MSDECIMGEPGFVDLVLAQANERYGRRYELKIKEILSKSILSPSKVYDYVINPYVMIAPILPEAEDLPGILAGKVDYIIIDRMNYRHADRIYAKYGWKDKNTDEYFNLMGSRIADDCDELGIECRPAYKEHA